MSEGETEELIFWRRLRDVDEREGAGAINKSTTG